MAPYSFIHRRSVILNDCGKTPTQTLAESRDGKTSNAELIRELNRAKVAFQLRTIKAVLGEVG